MFLCLGNDTAPIDPVPPVGMAVRRDEDGYVDGRGNCFLGMVGGSVDGSCAGVDVALVGAWVSDGLCVAGVPVGLTLIVVALPVGLTLIVVALPVGLTRGVPGVGGTFPCVEADVDPAVLVS